ncbi:beta-phosphoglucomutase [Flavobacterium cerinum]|uniref:Beta-phosphoglucomutase n=1 Tax=Flavobacterium cerinum TaxID=2502784 RepID=A0A3S3TY70_9FLAO|nr:beta-phosphoglucomutase [Flavobacterium cerinum]RWW93837.1 beta-phosphoglucomutase [Flavobacterium cerinum]
MSHKAFIFDLDGVIVDTAKYHFLAWQKIANRLGIEFTHEHNEQLKGVSRIRSLDLILSLGGKEITQEEKDQYLLEKNEDYLEYIINMKEDEILEGVVPVLQYLKDNGQKIALGSASKNARPILEKVSILHFFDAIVDGNDVTNAKPDPEVFLRAAQLVGALASDAIVFEDSVAGVQAANIAGMISIGIGDAKTLHEAQYNFNDFTEIHTDFLQTLVKK